MTRSQDPASAGRDWLWAGHADREDVIETLKAAFVHGRLTRDELGTRTGLALTAQTRAELAGLIADIPADGALADGGLAEPARTPAAEAGRPPSAARRRPLARAAAGSVGCLIIAVALGWAALLADPDGVGPHPYQSWARVCLFLALAAVVTAVGVMGFGVAASVERRFLGQLRSPAERGG